MSLLDLVQQQLGQADVQKISQEIGADPASTQQAIQAALPMMLGGMASATQHPAGESALQGALSALGGGSDGGSGGALGALGGLGSLGGLGGLAGALGGGGGGGILGSILGQHHDTVQDGVQQASGLDAGKAGKLLMLLAPFILRALAKHQQATPAQAGGGVSGGLQQAAQDAAAQSGSPHVGGILGKILGGLSS